MRGKLWYRSRTILLNLAALLAMVAPELTALPSLESWRSEIALALAIANVLLRMDTTEPVRARREDPPGPWPAL